jgi:hypothetical protein
MTEPTMDTLIASREQINRQIAALELGPVREALAELSKVSTNNTLTKLRTIVGVLPASGARDQIQNVVTVLERVPEYLAQVVPQLEAMAAEPVVEDADPAEPVVEDADPAADGGV